MRAHATRGWRWLLAAAACAATCGVVRADDPPKSPPAAPPPVAPPKDDAAESAAQQRLRRQELQSRANQWFNVKKDLITVCATCNGRGRMRSGVCSYCRGGGRRVSKDAFRKAFYDWMSPEWRARETSKDEVEARFKAMDKGEDRVPVVRSFRIDKDKIELVGECHGRVPVYEGTDTVPRDTQWVWSVEPATKRATWFVYGGAVDGEFGVSCGRTAAPGAPRREPLPPLAAEELKAIVEKAKPYHALAAAEREGNLLLLTLDYLLPQNDVLVMDAAVVDDSIQLTRAILGTQKDWAAVRFSFQNEWKDEFGRVEKRPRYVVGMQRSRFEKIVWSELAREEVFRLFEVTQPLYPGLSLRLPPSAR